MGYTLDKIKKLNKIYRESLRPDWTQLDYEQTDKGQKLPKPNVCKSYDSKEIVTLIKDDLHLSDRNLYDIIMSRRSIRQYENVNMTIQELSYLCKLTCSISKIGPGYAFGVIPTGGATSSQETYLFINNVESVNRGLYHYKKDTGDLELVREELTKIDVNKAILNQLRDCAVVFFFTTTPYRAEYKYQYVSHKMLAIEAGHASQNLYLASESIGYGMVAIAAYDQKLSDELLQLNPEKEFVIYVATVGKKIKK